ncbi:MAG: cupredoxin domain-containing protein [Chloroflexota bacterium]
MKKGFTALLALVMPLLVLAGMGGQSFAQGSSRTFTETGKTVKGKFLDYWTNHGGLAQQGFPISEEIQEKSDTDGKTYTVQYFERAAFELHPENAIPNDVLLSLLGNFLYKQKYAGGAPGQTPNNSAGSRLFEETGKRVGGVFLDYWQKNGGLAQQGFPISDEFQEKSELDGKTYKVQYFERAVFEFHPENQAPYNVLLSQLGTFHYKAKYTQATAAATATTKPAAGGVQEIKVDLKEWAVTPNSVSVSAGKVRIMVSNSGDFGHNLTVLQNGTRLGGTPTFSKSEGTKIIELDLKPGTYQILCSLPGHADHGQRGTLTVK